MIFRFFSGHGAKPKGSLPDRQRIYAVGDIHGCADLLEQLLEKIEADDRAQDAAYTQIIFLGDLIDRGPNSARVVARVRQLVMGSDRYRCLLGNHEEVFLKAIGGDLKALAFFTKIGGRETIQSYAISDEEYRACDYPELLALLRERIPAEHISFLESLEDLIIVGDYAFAHAGVRPEVPLAQQKINDLRWIRNEFLDHRGTLEKIIVHGHSISDEVETLAHRIGLDTGAYASGKLSAMAFQDNRRWVLQAGY